MKLSVIIPVYNEENVVEQALARVTSRKEPAEIIIANDGSTDRTAEKLALLSSSDARIKVINLEHNSGKGAAVKEGLRHVTGDVVLIQDADLEYDPAEYPLLIEPFSKPEVQVVYGSRLMKRNKHSYLSFTLGGILLTLLTNILYFSRITDEPTGYKLFRTELLLKMELESRGFEFCPEVTAKILRQGIHISEVPISYNPRKISEGKKIRFRDGLIAIWTLVKYRFTR